MISCKDFMLLMNWFCLKAQQEFVTQTEVKSEREKQMSYINTCMWNLEKNGTDESSYRAGVEMQMQKTDMWTWFRKKGRWGELWEYHWHIYTTMCKTDS